MPLSALSDRSGFIGRPVGAAGGMLVDGSGEVPA
jgi:hypothetical protein